MRMRTTESPATGPAVLAMTPPVDTEASAELCHGVTCPKCRGRRMELHQPDQTTPGRLLGICPRCHGWALVDEVEGGRAIVTPLPGRA